MVPNSIVITALKQLLIEPLHDDAGICFNLHHALLEMFDSGEWQTDAETIDKLDKMNGRDWAQICFDSMFKHWPKASLATPMYPITGGKMAYAENQEFSRMWDEHHHYGALRRELCQFCIDYMEKENEKANIQPDNSGSVAVD